jgi:multicomponent Na+:H+ antiporter subunit E
VIRFWYALRYLVWLGAEVLRATGHLARDVMTPRLEVDPAIVELPLRVSSRLEVAMMASSITITPGTLVLGVYAPEGSDRRSLFVHLMYPGSRDDALAGLREMESRLLLATRGREVDQA